MYKMAKLFGGVSIAVDGGDPAGVCAEREEAFFSADGRAHPER
jgi:hypothetical protein